MHARKSLLYLANVIYIFKERSPSEGPQGKTSPSRSPTTNLAGRSPRPIPKNIRKKDGPIANQERKNVTQMRGKTCQRDTLIELKGQSPRTLWGVLPSNMGRLSESWRPNVTDKNSNQDEDKMVTGKNNGKFTTARGTRMTSKKTTYHQHQTNQLQPQNNL